MFDFFSKNSYLGAGEKMPFKEQGLNKFVKVVFPDYFPLSYIASNLSGELGAKVNFRSYPTGLMEFLWLTELDHEVIEIRLKQYEINFSAHIEFSDTSDFPILLLV